MLWSQKKCAIATVSLHSPPCTTCRHACFLPGNPEEGFPTSGIVAFVLLKLTPAAGNQFLSLLPSAGSALLGLQQETEEPPSFPKGRFGIQSSADTETSEGLSDCPLAHREDLDPDKPSQQGPCFISIAQGHWKRLVLDSEE